MNKKFDYTNTIEYKRNIHHIITFFVICIIITSIFTLYILYYDRYLTPKSTLFLVYCIFAYIYFILFLKIFKYIKRIFTYKKNKNKYIFYIVEINKKIDSCIFSVKFILDFVTLKGEKITYVTDYYKKYEFF